MCQHHMDVDPSMCGGSMLVHAARERLSHILHMLSVISIIKIAKYGKYGHDPYETVTDSLQTW